MKSAKQRSLGLLRTVSFVGGVIPGWFPLVVDRVFVRIKPSASRVDGSFQGWRIDFDLTDYVQRKTYFRSFERREMRFLRRWLRPGDAAVDVGANAGVLTLVMARAVGATGRVIAVEPNPQANQVLARWLDANGIRSVRNLDVAAGDETGVITLGAPELQDASFSTGHYSASHTANPIEVRQVVLDDELVTVLDDAHIRLLKLDVEGMERQVLGGLRKHLSEHRIRALLFEVNPGFPDQAELGSILEAHGYTLHAIAPGGRVGRRVAPKSLEMPGLLSGTRVARNIIALAPR